MNILFDLAEAMSSWCGRVERGESASSEDVAAMFGDALSDKFSDVDFAELTPEIVGAGLDFAVTTAIVAPSTMTSE